MAAAQGKKLAKELQGSSYVLDGEPIVGLRGTGLRRMRRRLQMIFQDPYSSLDPTLSIRDILAEPLRRGQRAFHPGFPQGAPGEELFVILGGRVRLHSEVGRGTTFKVYLPTQPRVNPSDETTVHAAGAVHEGVADEETRPSQTGRRTTVRRSPAASQS